ncbi:MAG: NGG1p interacting factor NIF3 [Candidatus Omnitrophica bacterium]|nr:NGG1p interacting factor NIF3 [Candidatus Omnitrophota bacterium]MCB9721168.1 NGG1p interacting factor NIF3 [Candidatus Omnitrophota bacterium]
MKIRDLYQLCVEEGMKADPRTKEQVRKYFSDKRKELRGLSARDKKFFDKDCLFNPYADTRVLYGDPQREVRRILVGIDIGPGEIVMADQLAYRGDEIDLIIAHHPEGAALAGLHDVMHMQTDFLTNIGLKEESARQMMKSRIDEIGRRLHSINHTRAVDSARLLDIPLMCCHTPADNHVNTYLQRLVNREKPKTLKSIVGLLMKEPEYIEAARLKAGPEILVGKESSTAGRVHVDMTGGTEGSATVFGRMSQCGVDTLLGMHYSENHYKNIKAEHINVVNAGHMASDNLGMNLLLDKIEKKGKVEIVACSGFRRFRR